MGTREEERKDRGAAAEAEGLEYPRLRPVEAHPVEIDGRRAIALSDPQHYAGKVVCLSPEAASLLGLFDGRHSLLDIQAAFARRFGSLLFREELLALVRSLDESLLLDSPRFAEERAAVEAEFRRASSRPACFAGKGYPAEAEPLRRYLDRLFTAPDGPGDAGPTASAGRLVGLVVPHIDFARGGACYAWGYRETAALPPVERWLILGTAHAPMRRAFALTTKAFETPLGRVETEEAGLERLLARVGPAWLEDEAAHRAEHSIEFQAVFLRHCVPPERPLSILPVLCGPFHEDADARHSPGGASERADFLAALREVLAALPGRTMVLVSADLAHVGPQFGDPWPVTSGRLRQVEAADREMLAAVEAGDAEAFFRSVVRDGDTRRICGLPPIHAALSLLRGVEGRLLKYGQWHDPNGTVTFAALGLYAGG
ncbi:MAG: AmmeMemoRadiSam system protein B [candidate division NC10 bacterium]|nr:AmmeMemoRadiSam system protein B [candidate division NC10 bacterium]